VIVTVNVPEGVGAFNVTVADPDFVTSACATALTITGLFGLGTTAGAVYNPAPSTVPTLAFPPDTPFTCHATAVFVLPLTAAVNGCCSPGNLLAVFGLTLTEIPPPPPPPPPPPFVPPQEVSSIADAITSATIAVVARPRNAGLHTNPPIIKPTAGIDKKKGSHGRRSSALGRIVAGPGPSVLIVNVTVCAPLAPAVIAGAEQAAPAGRPEHEKFTAPGNDVAPTGVTTRL
jgi:hypothetical protein